jgi:hypothetical protein
LNTAKFIQTNEPIAAAAAASSTENAVTITKTGNGNTPQAVEPVLPLVDEVS